MNKRLTSWKGVQKGQKFKVIGNSNSHNYPMHTILTMARDGSNMSSMDDVCVEMHGNNLSAKDVELTPMCIKDLEAERDIILNYRKGELLELNTMIDFCKKYGLEKYNPKMTDAFRIVEVTKDQNMSDFDRMVAICKILGE